MKTETFLDNEQLVAKFPMQVSFPHLSGQRYVLHYYTNWERNKAIVASTVTGVYNTFRVVANQYPDLSIKGLHAVDIVSPPQKMKLAYARHALEFNKECFVSDLAMKLEWYVKYFNDLPQGITRCKTKHRNPYGSWKCCHGGFVFDSKFWWNARGNQYLERVHGKRADCSSTAPEADPKRTLYELTTGEETFLNEADVYYGSEPAFYCHVQEQDIPERFKQYMQLLTQAREAKKAIEDKEFFERQEKRDAAEKEELRAYFSING